MPPKSNALTNALLAQSVLTIRIEFDTLRFGVRAIAIKGCPFESEDQSNVN